MRRIATLFLVLCLGTSAWASCNWDKKAWEDLYRDCWYWLEMPKNQKDYYENNFIKKQRDDPTVLANPETIVYYDKNNRSIQILKIN